MTPTGGGGKGKKTFTTQAAFNNPFEFSIKILEVIFVESKTVGGLNGAIEQSPYQ